MSAKYSWGIFAVSGFIAIGYVVLGQVLFGPMIFNVYIIWPWVIGLLGIVPLLTGVYCKNRVMIEFGIAIMVILIFAFYLIAHANAHALQVPPA